LWAVIKTFLANELPRRKQRGMNNGSRMSLTPQAAGNITLSDLKFDFRHPQSGFFHMLFAFGFCFF